MWRGSIALLLLFFAAASAAAQSAAAPAQHQRMQIALLELDVGGGLDSSLSQPLSDRLREELFKTGAFTVVERNVMEQVLEEQSLHLAGCTTNDCAVEVGRVLGVGQMVAGSVSRVGIYLTVNARLIDVETSEVTAAESIDCECTLEDLLTHRLHDLAEKLAVAASNPEVYRQLDFTRTPQDTLSSISASEGKENQSRDDLYQAEFPPAVHRAGNKAAVWIEKAGIGAVDSHFGLTMPLGAGHKWVGSLSNGLVIHFPATRQLGWFHPQIQFAGGKIQKEDQGQTNTATITGVYFRFYNMMSGPRAKSGLYTGAGLGMLRRSEFVERPSIDPNSGNSYTTVRGEISLEAFFGSQFDLNWDVGGRKLFTFLEVRAEVSPFGDSPWAFMSVQSGLGWRFKTFAR